MSSLTNPRSQKRRTKQQVEDDSIEKEIIIALMRTGNGRRHVYRRLWFSGIWHESGDLDPQRMAWKAGLRNEGLRLLGLIHEHCPEHYAAMWQESNRLKKEADAADKAEAASPPEEETPDA